LSPPRGSWNKSRMSDPMGECLFGDSTPAPLKADFIAFLRDMVDFAVEALRWQGQASDAMRSSVLLSEATERGIARVEVLAGEVTRALEHADAGGVDALVGRCAAKIRSAAWDATQSEASVARAAVAAEAARATQAAASARTVCERALEALLLRHEPPGATAVLKVGVEGGTHYEAVSHGRTPYGLSWDVGLQIPPSHPLARVLRIDRIVERLEIAVPEETAWPHRGIKVKQQRFDRLYLSEVVLTPVEMFVQLRAAPDGTGPGYNLWLHRDATAARLERIGPNGAAPDTPCDIEGADGEKLRLLCDSLATMAGEVAPNRQVPVAARFDDKPIHEHEASVVIERLVANVAPQVDEISKRSLAPGELVLRRLLSDNRREEVFLSKAELLAKLVVLPPELRSVFAPLKLGDFAAPLPAAEPEAPAPDTVPMVPDAVAAPLRAREDDEPTVIVDESVSDGSVAPVPIPRTSDVRPSPPRVPPPAVTIGAVPVARAARAS
jgi:hypothetical protein